MIHHAVSIWTNVTFPKTGFRGFPAASASSRGPADFCTAVGDSEGLLQERATPPQFHLGKWSHP